MSRCHSQTITIFIMAPWDWYLHLERDIMDKKVKKKLHKVHKIQKIYFSNVMYSIKVKHEIIYYYHLSLISPDFFRSWQKPVLWFLISLFICVYVNVSFTYTSSCNISCSNASGQKHVQALRNKTEEICFIEKVRKCSDCIYCSCCFSHKYTF